MTALIRDSIIDLQALCLVVERPIGAAFDTFSPCSAKVLERGNSDRLMRAQKLESIVDDILDARIPTACDEFFRQRFLGSAEDVGLDHLSLARGKDSPSLRRPARLK